ncbi:MAG: lipopolysaccharide biosynthesis protein [Muribaculaceae bacterium]|nr:lipopolysaccharide biosynthesis protein [Muribaculaceae bacterium]
MAEDLKKETIKGVVWSAVELLSTKGIIFVANILLARLLTPEDFGLIAILTIFIEVAQTFIDSGFSNALIQKKDRSQLDYSTVYFFNLGIAVVLYCICFFCAPLIAEFFKNQELVGLTRVVCLNFLIGALISVHRTRLSVELMFKQQSLVTLVSTVVAAGVSLYCAYTGWGVWALVLLSLVNVSMQTLMYYIFMHWHPSLEFSITAFRRLFSYSSKLLGASLIHILYRQIYPVVIGKRFSPEELGYYNRADQFAMYPSNIVSMVVSRVAFPIFSRIQDDNKRLRSAYRKYITFTAYIVFPLYAYLIFMAKPLTEELLTSKWLPMVPLFMILALDWMPDFMNLINLNVLFVKGRSDLAFKIEVIKKTLAVIILFISLYWGILGVCLGRLVYGVIAIGFNSFYTNRLIGLSVAQQLKCLILPGLYSFLIIGFLLLLKTFLLSNLTLLSIGLGGTLLIYVVLLALTPSSPLKEIKQIMTR